MSIVDTIQRYRDQLDALLTGQPERTGAIRPLAERPLHDQLQVFEHIAQGKVDRYHVDPSFVTEVEEAVDQLLLVLCTPPDVLEPVLDALPRDIWTRSETGRFLSYVAWWLYQDELIGLSDAASMLYGVAENTEIVRVYRHIERGELDSYIDPQEVNPQYARRVRRSQVTALQEQQAKGKPTAPPRLPKDQVDIVKLHEVENMSFTEIGRLLGVKRQAVHQQYHRLKKQQSNE
jgi:predicted DNA-binding protein (UPF0251 family)